MKLTAEEKFLKDAILSEIDRYRYRFYEGAYLINHRRGMPSRLSEDQANKERLDFVDHVIARVRQMKAPEPETMDVPGIGRIVTTRGLREIAASYKLSEADREEIRKAKEAGLILDDWWADVPASLVEQLLTGVKVSAVGVDQQPRGHFLSVEAQRELRDNPPPRVMDDPHDRATSVRELSEDELWEQGYARNMHRDAARKWEHVADLQRHRVACVCFRPVETAEAATGRAIEASKAAPPSAAAFAASAAALTACALRDAPAAAEAHRRAAEAYSAKQEAV